MKEKIYLNLGHLELLSVIIRNGLYSGSWKRMIWDLKRNFLIVPGINPSLIMNLRSYEKKYTMNLDRIVFSNIVMPKDTHFYLSQNHQGHAIQRTCYLICRGLFSYPCVSGENRISMDIPDGTVHRTFLARPMYSKPWIFLSPHYQGVNRMKTDPNSFPDIKNTTHDRLFDQLNRIRECYPCDDQPTCMDHKYVMDATETMVKEYHLENSFIGKLLARSLCWMTSEESRLMRLIEKEGLMIEPQPFLPSEEEEESLQEEFFNEPEMENFYSENRDHTNYPGEPHPLLEVLHDLRESIRDTIRLIHQIKKD